MINKYDIGDVIHLPVSFASLAGAAVDPVHVVIRIYRQFDGTFVQYEYGVDTEVKRESPGNYYLDYSVQHSGKHRYRWESFDDLGEPQGAEEGQFKVRISKFYEGE